MKTAEQKIIIMNFSGIYEQENFYKDDVLKESAFTWLNLKHVSGCNCYCDDDAKRLIKKMIDDLSVDGIHFIDSGNYHYMSKIWMEKIDQPFNLLVFDNHTDMQPPAFGGILSCGGWIADALDEFVNLNHVFLVGPDEVAFRDVEEHIRKKTKFLSREMLNKKEYMNLNNNYFDEIPTDLPIYISIDKDILCTEDADTSWSQGDMSSDELIYCLKYVLDRYKKAGQIILGVDICGETDVNKSSMIEKNNKVNKRILKLLLEE